jgi:hypothetical protein
MDVFLPLFDQQRNVPLIIAYKARMDPTRRRRTLARKLHESLRDSSGVDFDDSERDSDFDESNAKASTECESDDSSGEEGGFESSSIANAVTDLLQPEADTIDLMGPISGTAVLSIPERQGGGKYGEYERVAAAHMLLLAGKEICVHSHEVALAIMLNPISRFKTGRSEEERERITKLATSTFERELASELEDNECSQYSSFSDIASLVHDSELSCFGAHDKLQVLSFEREFEATDSTNSNDHVPQAPIDRATLSRRLTADFWAKYTTCVTALCRSRDPLDFWQVFVRSYPQHPAVVRVLRRYLSIPPSAAACERLFSIMTASRAGRPALLPSTLRQLVFLRANQDIVV